MVHTLLFVANARSGLAASFVAHEPLDLDPVYSLSVESLSADGSTLVGYTEHIDEGLEAIRWDAAHGLQRFTPARSSSLAFGVSGDGSIVVGVSENGNGGRPVYWRNGSEPVELETTLSGPIEGTDFFYNSWAEGISEDGSVIVGRQQVDLKRLELEPDPYAFIWGASLWREGHGQTLLGSLGVDQMGSIAVDVSRDGSIVVGTTDSPDGVQAFVWDETNGMQGLGHLPSRNFATSNAVAVSADGSTIIGNHRSYDIASDQILFEGFIYSYDGGMQPVGDASKRWDWNWVSGISGDGSVGVGSGGTRFDRTDSEAFVWDADHGVRTVKAVLESLGVDLTGWRLSSAVGISEDGQTIVGFAIDPDGSERLFTAVIPEPGPLLLVGAGLTLLALGALQTPPIDRRRRSRGNASARD